MPNDTELCRAPKGHFRVVVWDTLVDGSPSCSDYINAVEAVRVADAVPGIDNVVVPESGQTAAKVVIYDDTGKNMYERGCF